eukprot:46138-Rhodomonas_salina.1
MTLRSRDRLSLFAPEYYETPKAAAGPGNFKLAGKSQPESHCPAGAPGQVTQAQAEGGGVFLSTGDGPNESATVTAGGAMALLVTGWQCWSSAAGSVSRGPWEDAQAWCGHPAVTAHIVLPSVILRRDDCTAVQNLNTELRVQSWQGRTKKQQTPHRADDPSARGVDVKMFIGHGSRHG